MLPSAGLRAAGLSFILVLHAQTAGAQTSEPLKPYIVLALDVSGSMGSSTGSGPPSCGGFDTRLDHARCAITNIGNAYGGDVVLGLGRFRTFPADTTTNSDSCTFNACGTCDACGIDCDSVGNGGIGASSPIGRSGDRFEVLVPILDGNQNDIVLWTDNLCSGDCTTNPEILEAGWTPLAGTLAGSKLYWQGLPTPGTDPDVGVIPYWTGPGDDPVRDDPLKDIYIVSADTNIDGVADAVSQCRPYIVILLTDGAESCATAAQTNTAATSLLTTTVDGRIYRIETKPIGFGIAAGDGGIEGIALAGGGAISARRALDVTGAIASNETVTIGGVVYRWRTTLAAAGDVHIAATVSQSLDNLVAAINDANGVEGVDYGTGTAPHATVSAVKTDANTITAIARVGGAAGNAIAVAETMAGGAWAGGTLAGGVDNPAGNQGYYATNEATLSIALSNIIQDSLRFEKCNGIDDDCDGLIDEDFPAKGTACTDDELGACLDTGTYICSADELSLVCTAVDDEVNPPPSAEVCNFADDDCDGLVDEPPASCAGCLPVETCNGRDDDCDGQCDEGLTRVCGTDVGECTPGTETCIEETDTDGDRICDATADWTVCDGDGPVAEQCDGLDNDCDGTVDGFTEDCTDMVPGPNPDTGICHPGQRTCPTDGSGWTACIGEVVPEPTDPCDGLDNDCDGLFEEDFVPTNCSSSCGVGTTECTVSGIVCNGSQTPQPETCNGFDDDCNGLVDDNITEPPQGEPCDDNGTLCVPGTWVCDASTGGQFECRGGEPPGVEICNCEDDNCNVVVDDGVMCPPGSSCVSCQCAFPCAVSEFPCPAGRVCVTIPDEGDFCLIDPCYQVDCPPQSGEAYECVDGACVRSCDPGVTTCPSPTVCRPADGECVFDDCRGFPERCSAEQFCVGGTCVSDPCAGVDCSGDQYCLDGACVTSCGGIDCPAGQRCVLGECQPDPCGGPCMQFDVCDEDTGECVHDPCLGQQCPQGEWCDPQTGDCEQDPCLGVDCPGAGEVCVDGTCDDPPSDQPDAGDFDYVAPGGGGGCAATPGGGAGALLALVLLALLAPRRRRGPGGRR